MSFRNFGARTQNRDQLVSTPTNSSSNTTNTVPPRYGLLNDSDLFGPPTLSSQSSEISPQNGFTRAPPGVGTTLTSTAEESTWRQIEQNLKSVIERLQEESRLAREELVNTSHSSKMIGYRGDYMEKRKAFRLFRDLSNGLIEDGRSLLRDWVVSLAGEMGAERHRKKLSYEKLQMAFEVNH